METGKRSRKRNHNDLDAKGRISGCSVDGKPITNYGAEIDGARLWQYDEDCDSVCIRVDHSTIPEFWMEIKVSPKQLISFVQNAKNNIQCVESDDEGKANTDREWFQSCFLFLTLFL